MLDKSDIGARLSLEFQRLKITPARVAERCGVTIQAITGWTKTGRFHRTHHETLQQLRVDIPYVLTGKRLTEHAPSTAIADQHGQYSGHELGELSQAEIDLVIAHRQVPTFVHDQIEGVLRGYLDHVAKDVAEFMGPRDLEHQRSIEPKLITEQIKAQSKDLLKATPPRKPKKPGGKKRRGKEGNHND